MKKKEEKKAEETESVVPDYTTIVGLKKTGIVDIVNRLREISELQKELKSEREDLISRGATIFVKAKVKSVMVGELRVTRYDGVSSRISKTKLFELGVSESTIQKATVESKYTSLKITEKGSESEGE